MIRVCSHAAGFLGRFDVKHVRNQLRLKFQKSRLPQKDDGGAGKGKGEGKGRKSRGPKDSSKKDPSKKDEAEDPNAADTK